MKYIKVIGCIFKKLCFNFMYLFNIKIHPYEVAYLLKYIFHNCNSQENIT